MAEHPKEADPFVSQHLTCCSPCFNRYMEILADLKRRKAGVARLEGEFPSAADSLQCIEENGGTDAECVSSCSQLVPRLVPRIATISYVFSRETCGTEARSASCKGPSRGQTRDVAVSVYARKSQLDHRVLQCSNSGAGCSERTCRCAMPTVEERSAMAHFICPPRTELDLLRTPLTAGELRVLDFFDRFLPHRWEIYIQPHLNGVRPDFVLLHPNVGIAVFEIKDWNLDAMPYFVREEAGTPSLWSRDQRGQQFRHRDNPVEKVVRYKREILAVYCPRLGIQVGNDPGVMAAVTAGVIMTAASTKRAADLFRPFLEYFDLLGNKAQYHPVAGQDALACGDLRLVFPSSRWPSSNFMTPELANDFRAWLREPEHAATQREPLPLNADQQRIATTRTRTGYRRVRGPAGCGKSLALAARASQLAGEGKDVLVVSFNITLLHYLRDLAVRYRICRYFDSAVL